MHTQYYSDVKKKEVMPFWRLRVKWNKADSANVGYSFSHKGPKGAEGGDEKKSKGLTQGDKRESGQRASCASTCACVPSETSLSV